MLTFLRKIRKSLIESGSAHKYLLYAIGEIALVVIGILIALSINNWNEGKKTNAFERKLLVSLRNSMVDDFRSQERAIEWNEDVQYACKTVLVHLEENLPYNDSLNAYFARATNWISFPLTDSEYKNVESYGLHLFQYDDTRSQLIRIHGRHVPLLNEMLEQQSLYYNNIALPLFTELFESTSKGGFGQERVMIPYEYDELIISKKYQNILRTNLKNRMREQYQMKYILVILEDVIEMLEEEIMAR